MQRAEHKVPGQRCLNCNFCGLEITDLTHQNCVRVLTQDRSKATSERHTNIGVDRNLDDAVDVILNRILGRDQFVLDVVEFSQG